MTDLNATVVPAGTRVRVGGSAQRNQGESGTVIWAARGVQGAASSDPNYSIVHMFGSVVLTDFLNDQGLDPTTHTIYGVRMDFVKESGQKIVSWIPACNLELVTEEVTSDE